jgi:hypothetical protein
MGSNRLVLLIIVIRLFKLKHPINERNATGSKENPIYRIGYPPVFQKPKKIKWPEKSVYE